MAGRNDRESLFTPRTYLYVGIAAGVMAIAYITVKQGLLFGVIFSAIPLVLYGILYAIKNPYWAYTGMFVISYFIMGLTRYIPQLMGGVAVDTMLLFCVAVLLIRNCYKHVGWERARTGLTMSALIWMVYCILELFNPMGATVAWATSIRGLAIYFFVIAALTPIFFYRYKDFLRILAIWSVLTLLAVAKAYVQRHYGFDAFEKRWLYESGGMTTHIIRSGVRYFSFYTDAGNFGSAMGFAMVVFTVASIYFKTWWIKLYYLTVGLLAAYGMIISGTRGALAVPFAGYALYLILSRRKTIIIFGSMLMLAAFVFLNFTHIGHSNAMIRRMRSAFNRDDASLNVRLDNQKLIAEYMADKPFGSGLGMGGGKAKAYAPNAYLSQIPTDSWFVMIWTETGIIGLMLYLTILLYVLIKACYMVFCKLKDKKLRGLISAITAGIFGMIVSSYGNEILGQLPSGIIVYMCMAFIFLSQTYDREIAENRIHEPRSYEHD